GTVARGRLGGLVAGLGFVLPGLLMVLLASWLLQGSQPLPPMVLAAFAGMQCVVVALVARAAWRLGKSVIVADSTLWPVLLAAAALSFLQAPFWVTLVGGGVYAALHGRPLLRLMMLPIWGLVGLSLTTSGLPAPDPEATLHLATAPDPTQLAASGLRAGLLTFGGAYTAIPFLQQDAVGPHGWMTLAEFQDGLAVSGMIPSPLIVFGAWVGWAGGGLGGALLVAVAIFLPAFILPLLLHDVLERIAAAPRLHRLLEGVTAAVCGMIGEVALQWTLQLDAPWRWGTAAAAWLVLARVGHRLVVLPLMAAAAAIGFVAA
ncbi:MAG: hypothetical protein RL398_3649, partial [Planctomycetota bacterium]